MANAKVLYTGNGSTTNYNVPFPYIEKSHVFVYVNDVLRIPPLHYTWLDSSTIQFKYAPGLDDAIEIKRSTEKDTPLVNFQNSAVLTAADLNLSQQQNFYIMQEAIEGFHELINNALLNIASGAGIVETSTDEILAAMVNEMLNQESAATIQQRITDIDNNAEAIISLGDGLQAQINTLAQGTAAVVYIQPNEPVPGVGGIPDPIPDNARWYDSDDNNHPYIYDGSIPQWLSIEDPRIGQAVSDISVLQTDVNNNATAIVDEAFARSTQDTAFAQTLSLLGAENPGGTAWIIDLNTVQITDGVESLADRFSSLQSSIDGNSASITTEQTTRANADTALANTIALMGAENGTQTAFILDSSTVKLDSDVGDTLATRFSALTAADNSNAAAITSEQTARISADSAIASDVSSLTTTVDGHTTTITQHASSINGLEGKYGVTIESGSYVSGFVLNGGSGSSSFKIIADQFAIVQPGTYANKIWWDGVNSKLQIDGDLIVNGTINGAAALSTSVANRIGSTHIGDDAISTQHIAALSIEAGMIKTGEITATQISGNQLDVLAANTGTLYVDEALIMNAAGHIRGGQTAYNTGTGYFLGYSGSQYKFSIGNGSDNYMTWDGTKLTVKGDVAVGTYTVDATNILHSANTERTKSALAWSTVKSFTAGKDGTVRMYHEIKRGFYSGTLQQSAQVRIKKNGVVQHTDTPSGTTYVAHTYDLSVTKGDSIDYEYRAGEYWDGAEYLNFNIYIKNAQMRGQVVLGSEGSVDLD